MNHSRLVICAAMFGGAVWGMGCAGDEESPSVLVDPTEYSENTSIVTSGTTTEVSTGGSSSSETSTGGTSGSTTPVAGMVGGTAASTGGADLATGGDIGDDTGTIMAGTTETVVDETGGADGGEVVAEPEPSALPTSLTFTVTTEPFGQSGRKTYTPRNIGAIWVETADGAFVKTLARWAQQRRQYLTAFNSASGQDVTDAVTSATLRTHETHEVTWDLTDSSGSAVEAGDYKIRVEGTEIDGAGPNISVPFTLGAVETIDVGTDGHFLNMSIVTE